MLQIPNLPGYQFPQPNYNAVKIDIHNPSVGGASCPIPSMPQPVAMSQSQDGAVTVPMYSYPQAPVYNYPTAPQQPYYMPVQQPVYIPQQKVAPQQAIAQADSAIAAAEQLIKQAEQQKNQNCPPCECEPKPAVVNNAAQVAAPVQQVNINEAPKAPEPNIVNAAENKPENAAVNVDVKAPEQAKPQLDLNAFLARLTNEDFDKQAAAMEDIANMVKAEPEKAADLLDAKVMDSLINIINFDSTKLAGPTQEQIVARQKLMSGKQISDEEKALATTITPMEQAERNKSYAIYTSAILQKLYKEEVAKLTGSTVPLTELPAAMTIVDNLKDNPNPMVRASAIEALSYIQTPEYKKDLTTLFTVAKDDQDKGVQDAAKLALDKLAQI